jgi:spermidine synthase
MNPLWSFGLFVLGFTASVAQVLLLRSLMATFHGNELSLGVGLGLWMTGTALGSLAAARGWFGGHRKLSMAGALAACSLALPSAVALGRVIGRVTRVARGEIAPLGTALTAGCVLVLPLAMLLGAVFALACRAAERMTTTAQQIVGRAFVLEAAGATAGGLAAAFVFLPLWNPLQTAFCLAAVCLGTAVALGGARRFGAGVACAGVAVSLAGAPRALDNRLIASSWPGYEVLAARDTRYQSLVLAGRENQVSLFSDGAHLVSFPQLETPELIGHLPLLQHPHPARVLLVGGTVRGVLREVLRHGAVQRVDCVELDPWVLRIALEQLPDPDRVALSDSRVRILHTDGRRWIQRTPERSYDVVILDLPDPSTAQLNRFFTTQFYAEVAAILGPGGVLAFRVSSGENYISALQSRYVGTLIRTARQSFPHVRVTPGSEAVVLGKLDPGDLTLNREVLLAEVRRRGVTARYLTESWLPSQLTADRLSGVRSLHRFGDRVNTDFRPVCYFFDTLLWSRREGGFLPVILEGADQLRMWHVVVALALPALVILVLPGRHPARAASYCLVATGAAMITVQMVLLVGYQAASGYVYSRVSLFVGLFMAGLVLGAGWALRASRGGTSEQHRRLVAVQAGIAIWCLFVAGYFTLVSRAPSSLGVLLLGASLPCGVLGGLVFPLASAVRAEGAARAERLGATSYALDLVGAASGMVVGTGILIPLLGLGAACVAAAVLTGSAALLLAAGLSKSGG